MIPTKPQEVQWTDAQWESIYAKGQDVLVAAAAGSGKTAVLVERIIQRILTDGIDVDRLLVVTFTNLSAREMKHRIEARIQQAIIEDPSNQHIKNQSAKIHQAQISTLHSFCLKLIQQHYDVLEIDPNFRTASEVENVLLLESVIDDVFETHYSQLNSHFIALTEQIGSDRNDERLRQIIKSLYYFSVANPNPQEWLDALDAPYIETHLRQHYLSNLNRYIKLYVEAAQDALEQAYNQLELIGDLEKHVPFVDAHRQALRGLLSESQIDKMQLKDYDFGRLPTKPRDIGKDKSLNEMYETFKAYYDQFKTLLTKVKEEFAARDDEELMSELTHLAPRVNYLAQMTKDVIQAFSKAKKERNILDFTDYEHFALRILYDEKGHPSEVAEMYRQRFEEILVDEYQDTNRVQEKIIASIKRGDASNGNLFMVGDVKQSIYKFRQADPSLFIEKYQAFNQPDQSSGWRIDLSQNFRSRKEVLNSTNYLFHHMMDSEVGEIEYDAAARLYYGAPFDAVDIPLHFNVLLEEQDSDLTGSEQEAHLIAAQVETILETQKVYDIKTKQYRPATYKDIVILERSYSNARHLQRVFKDRDIPFYVNSKQGYFEQTEIRLMLSFLRVIDNPLQDIYLVGLMRSVIYQFTEDELAQIRIISPNDDYYYQSIQHYMKSEQAQPELIDKLKLFLNDIEAYRKYSQSHPVYQLIDKIFNDHYLIQYFSGLVGGQGRRANLHGLFNKAVDFESSSFRGLFQFIRFIDQMIERGKDFGEENMIGPNDNVVRMMTIHSSKGLEFPFVIYSGLTRDFNMMDLNQPVILNQHEGLGLQYYDEEKGIFYPSLISMSIELTNRKEIISEEMRLIYVALTRAKEQLYLIGREKKEERLKKLTQAPIAQDKLTSLTRFNAKNPFELIYSVFSKFDNQSLIDALRFKAPSQQDASLQPAIEIKHIEAKDILPTETEEAHRLTMEGLEQQINKGGRDRATTREIEARLLFESPYQSAQHDASKQSVSELKRQLETEQADTNYDRVRQYRLGVATYNRPQFLEEQKRTAAEIGTLMHTVMQHLPFRKEGLTEEELNAYIDTLVQRAIISEGAINDIQRDDVMRFINSDLYQRIAESDEIYRELPFIVNQHDLESETHDNDAAIIQGMIDVVYVEEGTYHFVDYKTDAFVKRRGMTDDEIGAQLKEKYRIQMQYYKKALETITGQHVSGYLYFFKFGALVID
ncbi:helicase-exonuclease AddAB subunit AddA [Staphylococcus chromogenes]|uniref:helicase-exonuclease AddAB subunit AddA n=1 Tax=Staphylococcus chromogenes TaxID=46126 RepID=UPI000D1AF775|nr:helicase-exonuclease AddAB subunit AddA [Staphylococcus chromogenes]PTG56546.1 helicase-exonuclease AddAB subunit AddA [Staphylococcus chromogenes]